MGLKAPDKGAISGLLRPGLIILLGAWTFELRSISENLE
jgi:hypothetical protein